MKAKKISTLLLTTAMLASSAILPAQAAMAAEDSAEATQAAEETTEETAEQTTEEATTDAADGETAVPKYVFLFIGDGMSYPQIQRTMGMRSLPARTI